MAKVSIADNESGKPSITLPREVERAVWQSVMDAKERIGDTCKYIEVFRIVPLDAASRLEVKIVIIEPVGSDKRTTKIETSFEFDCSEHQENLAEALANMIVRKFLICLGTRMETLHQQALGLGGIIARLNQREQDSGNQQRCDDCGRKLENIHGNHLECPHCRLKNPDCLECGQKTVRNGFAYKCFNCGAEVGTH